jgi:hypothetical protein
MAAGGHTFSNKKGGTLPEALEMVQKKGIVTFEKTSTL